VRFALTWFQSHAELPAVVDPDEALRETDEFWTEWSSRCSYEGPYREEVLHSLVVLKGLTYRPTGGIVAAPTTSLPASIGGVRNWDYRYCWLRDATLTLLAFLKAGYFEEADEWRAWLLRAVAGDPDDTQIVYGVAGERRLPEWELEWLPGFEGSQPVRVGNAAAGQEQIDVYGEVTDALYEASKHNLLVSLSAWEFGRHMFGLLEQRWREPDEGIWEVRGERRHPPGEGAQRAVGARRVPGCFDEEVACLTRSLLRDPTVTGGLGARLAHAWVEAQVADKVARGGKARDVADRRHQRGGGDRADAGEAHQPTHLD
jgi:GH15 family glucan-1,4-alpha-glucosidase